ncbi:MAG: helix-turn-helix domain-containing protein [Ilumatobacteraceae bacterium]
MAAEIHPDTVDQQQLSLIAAALAQPGDRRLLVDADGERVAVPSELVTVLRAVVEQLRAGNGVSVASLHAELTTVEAAEMLGVSRPHLVKLLEHGAMPHRMVGSHRRVRIVDVLAYRDRQDEESRRALDELTAQAEELGLYDAP